MLRSVRRNLVPNYGRVRIKRSREMETLEY